MGELRKDPFMDRWVILAEERGARPTAITATDAAADRSTCPFCEGHEGETEAEIMAVRDPGTAPDTPGWQIRVVPNRYPALRPDAAPVENESDLLQRRTAAGHHEVIIEGVSHTRSISEMPSSEFRQVLQVYRERYQQLAKNSALRSAVLIKNVGAAAGASIEHSHSQLIATPVLPMLLTRELDSARRWQAEHSADPKNSEDSKSSLWSHWLAGELEDGRRVVVDSDEVVVVCPYAPRFPFETWLLPKQQQSHFERTSDTTLEAMADRLHECIRAIEACLGDAPYNYVVHSAPLGEDPTELYHWRIEILPRVTRVAGYEQATGLYINPVLPESSALQLREAWPTGATP